MVLKEKIDFNKKILINDEIPNDEILLIEANENKFLSKEEALKRANSEGLTLVCVSLNPKFAVCKLVDYQKLNFEIKKKKNKKIKTNNKEVRISFAISDNDLEVKVKKIYQFLNEGLTVKVLLISKGREKIKRDLGEEKCYRIVEELKKKSPKIEKNGEINWNNGIFYFYTQKSK